MYISYIDVLGSVKRVTHFVNNNFVVVAAVASKMAKFFLLLMLLFLLLLLSLEKHDAFIFANVVVVGKT